MNENSSCDQHNASNQRGFNLYQIGKWGALAVIAYYLFTEHRAHVVVFLPYILLLSCPLMHFFMHGKHSGHHQHHNSEKTQLKEIKP